MTIHVAALRGALRSSGLQDAGLAALLLAGTWAGAGAAATPGDAIVAPPITDG